jgi:diacylglycerol kinase (ATP)
MVDESKQIKTGAKTLHRMQAKQARRLRRAARWRTKLDKASRKLKVLEAQMWQLEQRVHALRNPAGQTIAQYATALRPARVILNPNGGTFARQIETPEKLVAKLRAHGIQAEVKLKTSGRAVRQWVREAVDAGEALVIAVGGDGTIEDVALPLMGSDTTLGIIPTGTMNNLARALGVPLDVDQACALLGAGIIRQIDAGCIRAPNGDKPSYFLETAGLGLAVAMPAGQNVKKGRWGRLPGDFRKMFDVSLEPTQIELDDGERIQTAVKLVTVSNSPLYGLNYLIAPDAKLDDGLLDLAMYDGMSDLEVAKYLSGTGNGQRVSNPNVHFYRTRRAHLTTREAMPATSDKSELPAQEELIFEVVARAISVIAGQGFGLTWPVDVVHSAPPLAGDQPVAKNEQAAEPAKPINGAEQGVLEALTPETASALNDAN